MKREFSYPDPIPFDDFVVVLPGQTIGEFVRTALSTGVTPDMPTPELSHDDDVTELDEDGLPIVDPYGNIATDWSSMAENLRSDALSRRPPTSESPSTPDVVKSPENASDASSSL